MSTRPTRYTAVATSATVLALAWCIAATPARATTMTFDNPTPPYPVCYTEGGMTVCVSSSSPGSNYVLLNYYDSVYQRGLVCSSSRTYTFGMQGTPFTPTGFTFFSYGGETATFTSSTAAVFTVSTDGPVTFPAVGWTDITSFTYTTQYFTRIDNLVFTSPCGNGMLDAGEECDDGANASCDGCSAACRNEAGYVCGDGVQNAGCEGCDDNNLIDGDGCDSNCRPTGCGNGVTTAGEQCDDGNLVRCDGCSQTCQTELGLVCGDGVQNAGCGEYCDDGNPIDGDGCDSNCRPTGCGNGVTTAGEQCDDGDLQSCDGCSSTCQTELPAVCGDGILNTACNEECDDGDTVGADGCSASCEEETCYACTGSPSVCTPITTCSDGDDCCAPACRAANDDDCARPVAVGPQFKVAESSYSYYGISFLSQTHPKVGAADAGDFVVVWQSYEYSYAEGTSYNVRGRRYDPLAFRKGGAFRVNTASRGDPGNYYNDGMPSLAVGPAGDFLVVWYGVDPDVDCDYTCTFFRRYGVLGPPLGGETALHVAPGEEYPGQQHANPEVTRDGAGNFVVVWESVNNSYVDEDVTGRRLDATGNLLGSEFTANTSLNGYQGDHGWFSVDAAPAGNFVVVWSQEYGAAPLPTPPGVFGRLYDIAGNPQGAEFPVSDPADVDEVSHENPEVAVDDAGNFVVVWTRAGFPTREVVARRFDDTGSPLGPHFTVTDNPSYPSLPAVDADAAGNFVVTWSGYGPDFSLDVFARRFNAAGNPYGGEVPVNTFKEGSQGYPGGSDVSIDGAGNFVVVWDGYGPDYAQGVFGQRFLTLGERNLFGKKLVLKNRIPDDSNKNTGVWVVNDPSIPSGARGTAADPRCNGDAPGTVRATLRFFSSTSGHDSGPLPLPCENWIATGPPAFVNEGYQYKDKELDQGPCRLVRVRGAYFIKAVCSGRGATTDLPYDLVPGTDEGVVNALLTIGPLRYCTAFDGVAGIDGSDGRRFLGRDAPPPGSCPVPPP